MRRAFVALGGALVILCLAMGLLRVRALEREELEAISDWAALAPTVLDGRSEPHAELVRAELQAGEDVTFEVCSRDALEPRHWSGTVELVVWHPANQEVVVRAPMDDELLARTLRSSRGACLVLARGEDLSIPGEYAIEAVWEGHELGDTAREARLRGRIIAHRPLSPSDPWPVLGMLLGALLLVVGLSRWRSPDGLPESRRLSTSGVLLRIAIGLAALATAGLATALLPLFGASGAAIGGLCIALVEVLAAVALVSAWRAEGGARIEALGLVRPGRAVLALAVAPAAGLLLWLLGGLAIRLVPATGEAPIEALVTWPSGTLAVALVAVVVPVAEELFFRGFIFGTVAQRYGGAVAFVATTLLFVLAHVPQDWGAWGGLVGILMTGVGLTALRWWTGSTLVSTLAHLVHNGVIVAISLAALSA